MNGFDINSIDIKHDLYTGETIQEGNMLTYLEDRVMPLKNIKLDRMIII